MPAFLILLFDSFVPTHLALRANLQLLYRAPAPVLGCVYLSNPWLKCLPFHFEILEKQFDIRYH